MNGKYLNFEMLAIAMNNEANLENVSTMKKKLLDTFDREGWIRQFTHPKTGISHEILVLPSVKFKKKYGSLYYALGRKHGDFTIETIGKITGLDAVTEAEQLSHPVIFACQLVDSLIKKDAIKTYTDPKTGQTHRIVIIHNKHTWLEKIQKAAQIFHNGFKPQTITDALGFDAVDHKNQLRHPIIFAHTLNEVLREEGWIHEIIHPDTEKPVAVLALPTEQFKDKYRKLYETAIRYFGGASAENIKEILGMEFATTSKTVSNNIPQALKEPVQAIIKATHR